MKKLLTLILLAVTAVLPAIAYTVDEIVSTTPTMIVEYIYADYFDNDYTYYPYHHASEFITLKKGSDDKHIILSGIAGTLDFEFELVTSNGTLTNDGVQLQINGYKRATGTSKGREGWYMIMTSWTGMKYTNYRNKHTVLNITKANDGFHFSEADDPTGQFGFMVLPAGTIEMPNYCGVVVDQFNFEPFNDANGFAKATVRQYDNVGTSDQLIGTISTNAMTANLYMVDEHEINYPVKVEAGSTPNTFTILNLNNMGYAVDASQSRQMTGQLTTFKGSYDPVAGTATINAGQSGLWDWGHIVVDYYGYYQDLDWGLYCFSLTPFTDINGQKNDPIIGTYKAEDGPYHNNVDFGWVTTKDRGKRRTFEGASMTFPTMTYCSVGNTFYDTPNWLDTYHDTEILFGADVTLDVELELECLQWHTQDGIYVTGNIKTNRNDQYVESYDIMLVKGWYDHIEQDGFLPHSDKGHESAIEVCVGPNDAYNAWNKPHTTMSRTASTGGEHDYSFGKLLSTTDLGHTPSDGKYTAFIRANYKPETGLTPTFHSLTYLREPINTSVNDLLSEGAAPTVKVIDGGIEISGTENRVEVVDMTGRVVYSGTDGHIKLPASIYVVRVGSCTCKVAVR